MGESKETSPAEAGPSASTVPEKGAPEKSGHPEHPAASAAAPPVQGVPVGAGAYYPQYGPGYQNSPVGYGSYGTQGAPGTAAYPYHSQEPQSFEVHEVHRPREQLPCLIGYQLILFILGWFFPILWYFGAFVPLCARRIDPREKLGWLVNSAAAVIFTIVLIVVLTRYHYNWQNYGYGPY